MFYTPQRKATVKVMQVTFFDGAFTLLLAAEGFFISVVLQNNLCSPRHIMTAISISVLGILLCVQCLVKCMCCPCADNIGRFFNYLLFIVLGIAQTVASVRCDDVAKEWVYSIDAGIVLLLCSSFICVKHSETSVAT